MLSNIKHIFLFFNNNNNNMEPPGLLRTNEKRPDGMTLVPWKSGRPLVWDTTCPDTFATSYRGQATAKAGDVAARAEKRKLEKYQYLAPHHLFQPVAIETSGVIGPSSLSFLKFLGDRLASGSGNSNSTSHLLQRLSIAVQRGKCVAILGTISSAE